MSNMEDNAKLALKQWICGAAPESAHPFDMERFYNLIYEAIKSDSYVSSEDIAKMIKENLQWVDEEVIENFASEKAILIENIKGFLDYLKSQKRINVYNML